MKSVALDWGSDDNRQMRTVTDQYLAHSRRRGLKETVWRAEVFG